jgi:hypothetical protein
MLLPACAQTAVAPIVQRPDRVERSYGDGLTDTYARFVERARGHLRRDELILAEAYFEIALLQRLFERSGYEIWIELAEVQCRVGKRFEGKTLIEDYQAALDIDFEKEPCDLGRDSVGMPINNPAIPPRVFPKICSEDVRTHGLIGLSPEEMREVEATYKRLVTEAEMLREQCAWLAP